MILFLSPLIIGLFIRAVGQHKNAREFTSHSLNPFENSALDPT
jgi:hypothetical protein